MKALLLSLLLLPLVAKGQDVALPFFAADAVSAASADALPQSTNITMYWDSTTVPQGKQIAWADMTNNVQMVANYSNTPSLGYIFNTPDGMIISSSVLGNNGRLNIGSPGVGVTIGTNYSVWMTYKKEDMNPSQMMLLSPPTAGFVGMLDGYVDLYNLGSYPAYVMPVTNWALLTWSDIVLTFQNKTNYVVYIDGVLKTNWTHANLYNSVMSHIGYDMSGTPNVTKVGQIVVWTNKILTATEAGTLHQRMTNTMFNVASVSNAPPTISGLRNAWKTAGQLGLWRTNRWVDHISGKSFTANHDWNVPGNWDRGFTTTGRGMRVWRDGSFLYNWWKNSDVAFPASYTLFLTFAPIGATDVATMFATPTPGALVWGAVTQRLQYANINGHYLSPALTLNRTHTLMAVDSGTTLTTYVDGVYYTNVAGSWNGQTISYLGHYNFTTSNLNGYISELLIATNTSLATNDAASYHTYATNQYGFDWYGGTNAYGYYFTADTNSTLWASPILQQQTNTGSEHGIYNNVGHQKIKNTSSTNVTIKNIRLKVGEGSVTGPVDCWMYVITRVYGAIPIPDYGGYSSTNTLASGAANAWRDFTFSSASMPTIPANTDFWIVMQAYSAGSAQANIAYSTSTGGTNYQNTTYAKSASTSYNAASDFDFAFEIFLAGLPPCTGSSNLWSWPILQQQTADNNWSDNPASTWTGQKIKNTSGGSTRIKAVRFKTQNNGGATGMNIYAFCCTNAAIGNPPSSSERYGGFSNTNVSSATLSGPVVWETFTWADGNEPIIPPNTDFTIGWKAEANGLRSVYQRNIGTGNAYLDLTYCYAASGGGTSANDDVSFEIYTCP